MPGSQAIRILLKHPLEQFETRYAYLTRDKLSILQVLVPEITATWGRYDGSRAGEIAQAGLAPGDIDGPVGKR